MKRMRKLVTAVLAGSVPLGLGAAGMNTASAATAARATSLDHSVRCSKTSLANLQVQREDNGKVSVDAGVDMARHVAKVPWRMKVTDNGTTLANATVHTISDGSFSVTREVAPRASANHVVFVATNLRTGETCRMNGTV
jgi:hypothetical protein